MRAKVNRAACQERCAATRPAANSGSAGERGQLRFGTEPPPRAARVRRAARLGNVARDYSSRQPPRPEVVRGGARDSDRERARDHGAGIARATVAGQPVTAEGAWGGAGRGGGVGGRQPTGPGLRWRLLRSRCRDGGQARVCVSCRAVLSCHAMPYPYPYHTVLPYRTTIPHHTVPCCPPGTAVPQPLTQPALVAGRGRSTALWDLLRLLQHRSDHPAMLP